MVMHTTVLLASIVLPLNEKSCMKPRTLYGYAWSGNLQFWLLVCHGWVGRWFVVAHHSFVLLHYLSVSVSSQTSLENITKPVRVCVCVCVCDSVCECVREIQKRKTHAHAKLVDIYIHM